MESQSFASLRHRYVSSVIDDQVFVIGNGYLTIFEEDKQDLISLFIINFSIKSKTCSMHFKEYLTIEERSISSICVDQAFLTNSISDKGISKVLASKYLAVVGQRIVIKFQQFSMTFEIYNTIYEKNNG